MAASAARSARICSKRSAASPATGASPAPELGLMMIELLPYYEEAPWVLMQPVAVVFLLVLGLVLLADEDPR